MSNVTPFVQYLAIPKNRGSTEELTWSQVGDAIEAADGSTFVLTQSLPPFIEGFAAQRPLIHFEYLLDLLRLLGFGGGNWGGIKRRCCEIVRDAHRAGGRSLRNAGAFFAHVCGDVPAAWLSHASGLALAKWLADSPVYPTMARWENPEEPPFDLAIFRALVAEALNEIPHKDIYHWMRFGQPPLTDEGKVLAEEILLAKPPASHGSLEDLLKSRPRLAGAFPLVGTMVSALSLPPRRRTPPELPIGGYSDVTTRGDPAQLLPSQLALDPDEFVRRFAENELLFFRREEPNRRMRERLVLLVDQGVRTWGTVRLALSAAVLAFGKLAQKRDIPVRVRFGSEPQQSVDPFDCDWERFAELLEGSDLTSMPVGLLVAEHGDDAEEADLVLLTHPYALLEEDVRFHAASLPESKRLFALAVAENGSAEFSELRHGEPVAIGRFRVDFSCKVEEPVGTRPDRLDWTGAVEPVPIPFAIGPFYKVRAIGFDADEQRLLIAADKGFLHLYSLTDGQVQMLPRAIWEGNVLNHVEAIVGVRGGLVVGGIVDEVRLAAHYDLATRNVRVHSLGPAGGGFPRWHAFPELRAVAVRLVGACRSLELTTGASYTEPEPPPSVNVFAYRAFLRALQREFPSPVIPVASKLFGQPRPNLPLPFLEHDRETGRIVVHRESGNATLLPHADGRLLFTGDVIRIAQTAGDFLAVKTQRKINEETRSDWFLVNVNDQSTLHELPAVYDDERFNRLSPGGRWFARYWTGGQFVLYKVGEMFPGWTTSPGRIHNPLSVWLGRRSLRIIIGAREHLLAWRGGPLMHEYRRVRTDETLEIGGVVEQRKTHAFFAHDPARFYAFASRDVDVILDAAGQVVVFDPHRNRVACIFHVWRDELAAWLPDGTRYGRLAAANDLSPPDALDKIGAALRAADTP